jgi:23S rRNA (guanine2445-N2)-methyltransferase / 23S rRNA (guanine2069-N7)-methyltransferase
VSASYSLFASSPRGLSDLLAEELKALGAVELRMLSGGVHFQGTLEVAYRACLWSRVASSVLLELERFEAGTPDELYAGVRRIDWRQHIGPEATLACEFTSTQSPLQHSQFALLRTKDAIVDQLREVRGARPSIDTADADVRVHVHAQRRQLTVSVNLAGESLHQRGYRARGGIAPLKENLAAGILLRAGWPEMASAGAAFVDPLCGSGTFVIEAALMARDIAPGLLRKRFGFAGWGGHDEPTWQRVKAEALSRRLETAAHGPIRGSDQDARAVRSAVENLERAGLTRIVHVERRDLERLERPTEGVGLVCTNPPYGERLGEQQALEPLYRQLGKKLREHFGGWRAVVLTANAELGRAIGIRARRVHTLWNGPIECRLLRFDVEARWFESERAPSGAILRDAAAARARPGAQMFANRLKKNLRELEPWAKQHEVSCYRIYDADMPEYAFAIDLYQGDERWLYVQEYEAPGTVDPKAVRARRDEALSVLPELLGIPLDHIHFRTRRKHKRGEQYTKRSDEGVFHRVRESGLEFLVNFTDYQDTGLFLDHRPTRALIRERAAGERFLNLFCYTGSATVYAAAGGARTTLSVDLSNTYLAWARRNLELNKFGARDHPLLRADCVRWLEVQNALGQRGPRFGLIFLDPPTFSHSKSTRVLDVQRDHVHLITLASGLLTPQGSLLFSTNRERFRLDRDALAALKIEDLTARSIPRDFAGHTRIHQVFEIRIRRATPPATSGP